MSEAIEFVPFEVFLVHEATSEQRHELVAGRVYAHAGGTERHELIAGLIFERLAPGARRQGCRPFIANRMLRMAAGDAYYPDVMIAGGPDAEIQYEVGAAVIVEVLSPSTTSVDRREKAGAYARLPGLGQLLLVHPDIPRIEEARPSGGNVRSWTAYGPGQVVFTPYGDIDIDELYDAVDRTALT